MKYFTIKEELNYLRCPDDRSEALKIEGKVVTCGRCRKHFRITKNIIEFVKSSSLDKRTKKELVGNTYSLDKKTIEKFASKDKWSTYHQHCSDVKLNQMIRNLNKLKVKGVLSLGSGTGFEIKKILSKKRIPLVFSSDLSLTATMIVPYSLRKFNTKLGLFTSDFNNPPFRPSENIPVIVYEAMHHTKDIHKTFDNLLSHEHKNILFVEPTTNFIVKLLAKFGLAERVEYSGLKPSFLYIPKLRKLCKKHGYRLHVRTLWEFPEDYFRKIFGNSKLAETLFLGFVDFASWIGNIFRLGSMSVGELEKISYK